MHPNFPLPLTNSARQPWKISLPNMHTMSFIEMPSIAGLCTKRSHGLSLPNMHVNSFMDMSTVNGACKTRRRGANMDKKCWRTWQRRLRRSMLSGAPDKTVARMSAAPPLKSANCVSMMDTLLARANPTTFSTSAALPSLLPAQRSKILVVQQTELAWKLYGNEHHAKAWQMQLVSMQWPT